MKGLLFSALVFVLMAAVINVVVAVACALWARSGQGGVAAGTVITGAPEAMQQWYVANKPWQVADSFAGVLEEQNPNFIHRGWQQKRLWEPSMDFTQGKMPIGLWRRPKVASAIRMFSGWPMRCFYGEQWTRYIDGGERNEVVYRYAIEHKIHKGMADHDPPRIIPLRPIWLGFVVNTTFFGGILWVLIYGPSMMRGVIRLRRGRCAGCGYPVGTSAVCTECGKDL